MELFLVRHGITYSNEKDIFGNDEESLSNDGIIQVKKTSEELKSINFDIIFTSNLKRCVETTNEILKNQNCSTFADSRIQERNMGKFVNKSNINFNWDNIPESVERTNEFYRRIKNFLEEKINKLKNKKVLIVAHSGVINAILKMLNLIDKKKHMKIKNASITKLTIINNRVKLEILNKYEYLKERQIA